MFAVKRKSADRLSEEWCFTVSDNWVVLVSYTTCSRPSMRDPFRVDAGYDGYSFRSMALHDVPAPADVIKEAIKKHKQCSVLPHGG